MQGEVWGVAYRIAEEKAEEVRAYLDHREKAGCGSLPDQIRVQGMRRDAGGMNQRRCSSTRIPRRPGPTSGSRSTSHRPAPTTSTGWAPTRRRSRLPSWCLFHPWMPQMDEQRTPGGLLPGALGVQHRVRGEAGGGPAATLPGAPRRPPVRSGGRRPGQGQGEGHPGPRLARTRPHYLTATTFVM